MSEAATTTWVDLCPVSALVPERGVAALVGGEQVAVFLVDGEVFALGNVDPFSGAAVLSRGLVGSHGEHLTVASPVHKQRFDLRTGECLDEPGARLPTYQVRLGVDWVQLAR